MALPIRVYHGAGLKQLLRLLLPCCLLSSIPHSFLFAQVAPSPLPSAVHRVLFLGNSITYAGAYITDAETWWRIHYPGQRLEWINAGLPSETVSGLSEPGHADGRFPRPDLHERLQRVLARTKPELVFACYGMNDGIYLPLDPERFQRFRDGILWMHRQVESTGAAIIHLTPPVFDEVRGGHAGYGAVLDTYSSWLLSLRDSLHWRVADVHFPMKSELDTRRLADSSFLFAPDGVHPDSAGHLLIARLLLEYLHAAQAGSIHSTPDLYDHCAEGKQIYSLIGQRQQWMKDAWLTATRHLRPGMPIGLPMREAKRKYRQLDRCISKLRAVLPAGLAVPEMAEN